MDVMNNRAFDSERIALGYANRPWIHQNIIKEIAREYAGYGSFQNGLDVGCGAGLSTKALKLICEHVTGTDISEAMINVCRTMYKNPDYDFYVASAEETHHPEQCYDIVTAAGMVNWVEKDSFLDRMHEVMTADGLLLVYDFWITDQMIENTAYKDWYQNQYLAAFPKPPRKENIWQQDEIGVHFHIQKQSVYEVPWKFKLDDFIEFMMIQSNVNAKIESGEKIEAKVREWMKTTLYPIFGDMERTLLFEGYCWYIEHQ